MKPIRFDYTDRTDTDRYHYLCDDAGDMSGAYVPLVKYANLEQRNRELMDDNKYMIDLAGDAIGTDADYRTSACVKVLVDHCEWLRKQAIKESEDGMGEITA